jgi:hypothetical protein
MAEKQNSLLTEFSSGLAGIWLRGPKGVPSVSGQVLYIQQRIGALWSGQNTEVFVTFVP